MGSYHHEGPFDATLASRQIPGRAPIEATVLGNSLALAATPNDYVQRALRRHEPLDGISSHASGTTVEGQRFDYEEEDVERQQRGRLGHWPETETETTEGVSGSSGTGRHELAAAHKKAHFEPEVYEMQGSSRGVVEYTDDAEDVHDSHGSTSSKGVLSGLKKRLSVKKH